MKSRQLQEALEGKLGLVVDTAHRHIDYKLRCAGKIISLPTLVRISHGQKELTPANIGGVAKALGLNEIALKQFTSCYIGKYCTYLCLCVRLLQFVANRKQQDGEVFRPGLIAMLQSIELLLKELVPDDPKERSNEEVKALKRSYGILSQIGTDPDLAEVSKKLIGRIGME